MQTTDHSYDQITSQTIGSPRSYCGGHSLRKVVFPIVFAVAIFMFSSVSLELYSSNVFPTIKTSHHLQSAEQRSSNYLTSEVYERLFNTSASPDSAESTCVLTEWDFLPVPPRDAPIDRKCGGIPPSISRNPINIKRTIWNASMQDYEGEEFPSVLIALLESTSRDLLMRHMPLTVDLLTRHWWNNDTNTTHRAFVFNRHLIQGTSTSENIFPFFMGRYFTKEMRISRHRTGRVRPKPSLPLREFLPHQLFNRGWYTVFSNDAGNLFAGVGDAGDFLKKSFSSIGPTVSGPLRANVNDPQRIGEACVKGQHKGKFMYDHFVRFWKEFSSKKKFGYQLRSVL